MAKLTAVMERLSERARRPVTLNGLLEAWRSFVTEVEQGYQHTVYDYTNDMYARIHLEEVMESAPAVRRWVVAEVGPWDNRFIDATRIANSRPPGIPRDADDFYRRVPARPGENLARDLRDYGA